MEEQVCLLPSPLSSPRARTPSPPGMSLLSEEHRGGGHIWVNGQSRRKDTNVPTQGAGQHFLPLTNPPPQAGRRCDGSHRRTQRGQGTPLPGSPCFLASCFSVQFRRPQSQLPDPGKEQPSSSEEAVISGIPGSEQACQALTGQACF